MFKLLSDHPAFSYDLIEVEVPAASNTNPGIVQSLEMPSPREPRPLAAMAQHDEAGAFLPLVA